MFGYRYISLDFYYEVYYYCKKTYLQIQAFLLITGIFLILLTYFYYPYLNKNKSVVEKKIQENLSDISNTDKDTTLFEKLEYKGLYDLDKNL